MFGRKARSERYHKQVKARLNHGAKQVAKAHSPSATVTLDAVTQAEIEQAALAQKARNALTPRGHRRH